MSKRKKSSLMDSAAEAAENIRPTIESAIDTAREQALPLLQDGRDLAVEKAHQGREYAAEKAPIVKAAALEKATQGREYAAEKANEMRGIEPEPEKKKGSKLKKLFFVGVLAGLGGFLYKKLSGGSSSQANWQSSYVPAPAPKPAAPPASKEQEDQGAAAPGEAIADGTGEPKADSTPDDPAEVIDIDDSRNT